MNAPLVEFLLRFRERERENAAQREIAPPVPIFLRAHAGTRGVPSANAGVPSRSSRPTSR